MTDFWITATAGTVLSFLIVYASIPFLIKLLRKNKLYDAPDNNRKVHKEATPTLGGMAITTAILIAFPIAVFFDGVMDGYHFIVSSVVLLFLIGFKDDLLDLSARVKFLAQIFVSLLLILGTDLRILDFGGIFGIHELPYIASLGVTLIAFLGIINSYNMIDGIDGLASGIGIIASAFFGISFFITGNYILFALSLVCVGALLGFLVHNFSPAKIFMGDTGSLPIGLMIAIQAIFFINLGIQYTGEHSWLNYSPVLGISALIVPLYDTLRVMIMRLLKGKSLMSADRSHVHHHLLNMGMGHKGASITLYFVSASFIGLNVFLANYVSINALLLISICTSLLVFPTNMWKRRLVRLILKQRQQSYDIDSLRKKPEDGQVNKKNNKELVEELY